MKLSIITVNLNNKDGLQKTINSVISQTFKDFEWIIIDGGSTDGSKELIENYSDRLTYWVSEPDKGIYNAMNKGIKMANGDYLLFLNSGDCFFNEFVIEKFYNSNINSDVIYGNAIVVDKDGKEVSKWHNPENLRLSYFWGFGLNHQSTFIHRRCFEHYMYNEDNVIASDLELFIQLLYNSYSFKKYNEYVALFDNTGISHNNKLGEFDKVIKRSNFLPIFYIFTLKLCYNVKSVIIIRNIDLTKGVHWIWDLKEIKNISGGD